MSSPLPPATSSLLNSIRLLASLHANEATDLGREAAAVLAALGTEGDVHEATQRHPSGRTGRDEPRRDTDRHAKTWADWATEGRDHDMVVRHGFGVTYSEHRHYDWERTAKELGVPEKYRSRFIPADDILTMANEINAHRSMVSAGATSLLRELKDREKLHPGYDTEDNAAKGPAFGGISDDHRIDTSESTIHLSVRSGDSWLNGSKVKHQHCVSITVKGPDGRELCNALMTFDQFAAFLTSRAETPCTMATYWSLNDQNVRLRERVRPADSVNQRLERRIRGRMDEKLQWIVDIATELEEAAKAGKPIGKTAAAKMAGTMLNGLGQIKDTADFAVTQAQEEITGVVEQAATHIALSFGLPLADVINHPMVTSMAVDQVKLNAPDPREP